MNQEEYLKPSYSGRRFKRMPEFQCTYNSTVNVRESSNAEGPHIWLDIEVDTSVLTDSKRGKAVAHLNFEQAKMLIEQLQWLMENHYQIEWEREEDEIQSQTEE